MSGVCEVGILFADIAGSTRIYELLGDRRALAVVNQCFQIIAQPVKAHGGIVVKTIGDELMAAFARPMSAYTAAVEIQRRFHEMPALPGTDGKMRVGLRIGFHFGTALREHEDYFGDTVNIAARVVGLAKANQILTTGEVMDILPAAQRTTVAEFARIEVKGRTEPVRVASVQWEEKPQNTTVIRLGTNQPAPARETTLRLVFEGRNMRIPPSMRSIRCGREDVSDLILKSTQVSRAHATIERRRDKIVLIDHSTNGTYLVPEHQQPIKLHREEFGLMRCGRIVFGEIDSEEADIVYFFVD